MTRRNTIVKYLDWLAAQRGEGQSIMAMEIGRLRDVAETVGHSTLFIAEHPAVARLVSVDLNPDTERVCRGFLPPAMLAKVEFVNMPSTAWLEHGGQEGLRFDFAYVDGASDAAQCLIDIQGTLRLLRQGGIMIQDDVDHRFDVKGDLSVPWLKSKPWRCDVLEEVPADATSQGQIVVCKV